jgi:adenosylhomocysteine nucleosidase
MPVGLIAAIPQELVHLREALAEDSTETRAGLRFARGRLEGREVVLAEAGIGKVNTALVATLLIDHYASDPVVFSGVAGGLDPELHIGDVVIAEKAIQHDFGVRQNGRLHPYQAGHIPFFNPTDRMGFEADAELLARVQQRLAGLELPPLSRAAGGLGRRPRIVHGTVLTGDQFLNCETTRERLHAELGGQAVEMEGAALAQVAERFDRRWLLIRALSDLAGHESSIDFGAFVEEVATSSALILRRLLPVL